MTLLTQQQTAQALLLSTRTLERWRVMGLGPKFVRMGVSIRYRAGDVVAWIERQTVSSTSEKGNGNA